MRGEGQGTGMAKAASQVIEFTGSVVRVAGRLIIRLPQEASVGLPSRGQVAAAVTVGGQTAVALGFTIASDKPNLAAPK